MFFAHIYTRQQVSSAVLVFQLGTMDHALVLCLRHIDGYFAPLHHASSAVGVSILVSMSLWLSILDVPSIFSLLVITHRPVHSRLPSA
jgi:hypothetical protein